MKPIVSAPPLKGFKRSAEPILATGKLRYVGEIVAMCVARTRAEAEDIAGAVTIDYDELPVVADMLAASADTSVLVHEEWGDNIFVDIQRRRTDRGGGEKRRHQSHQANSNGAPLHAADGGPRRHRLPGRAAAGADAGHLNAVSAFGADRTERMPWDRARALAHHFARCRRRLRLQGIALPRRGRARLGWRCRSIIRCAGWRTAASI